MPDQTQYPPQNPTAPREPAYGEVAETEELAAVDVEAEEMQPQTQPAPAEEQIPEPNIEQGPPRNIVGVLPPESTAPSQTGMPDLPPDMRTARAILAIPGIDPSVRGLAMAVLNQGRMPGPGYFQGEMPPEPPAGEYDTTELGEE